MYKKKPVNLEFFVSIPLFESIFIISLLIMTLFVPLSWITFVANFSFLEAWRYITAY